MREARYRDEYELEIKRNVLYDCGDILYVQKPVYNADPTLVPCRLLEQKKSLTQAKHSVKLRKVPVD